MADDAPTDACARVQPQLAGLAVGDVTPADEAVLDAHVATCARCRAELDALLAVVADVGQLAPPVEPGPALVDRLLAGRPGAGSATAGPGTAEGRPAGGGAAPAPAPAPAPATAAVPTADPAEVVALGASRRRAASPARRRWLVAAVAAVVALLLGLAGGVALGRARTDDRLTALDRVGVDTVRTAVLQGAGGPGGTVVVTGGDDPLLVMSLDHVAPGVRYGCALRTADGELVTVGSWTPAGADERSWAVPLPAAATGATAVVLTGPDGRPLAEGALA